MATLFISYKRDDKVAVTKISDRLKKEYYYDIWIDAVSIPGGEDWRAEIRKGIDKADVVLLMLTPDACASVQVKEEVDYAKSVGRKIMPLQIKRVSEDDQNKLGVAHLNYIDFLASHDDRFAWEKLLNDLPPVLNRNKRLLDPQFKASHEDYLRSLFTRYGDLSLGYLLDATPKETISLFDVYVPLKLGVDFKVEVDETGIIDWWLYDVDNPTTTDDKSRPKSLKGFTPQGEGWEAWRVHLDEGWARFVVRHEEEQAKKPEDKREAVRLGEYNWGRLESEDAPALMPHIVITGAPGSGKSTLLKHLMLCMAGDMLHEGEESKADLNKLGFWTLPAYTPIFIELRALIRTAFPQPEDVVTLDKCFAYIEAEHLKPYGNSLYMPHLKDQLRDGDVMIFLDGLDEVPDADMVERREQIKMLAHLFRTQYPQCRIAVTSRPYAYAGDWQLNGFGQVSLTTLDQDRLEELALRLFRVVLGQEGAEQEAGAFKEQMENVPTELRGSPLFFTLMASIWLNNLTKPADQRLPIAKGDIYRECVEMLVRRWGKKDATSKQSLLDDIGLTQTQLRQVLETLAHHVHSETGEKDDAEFTGGTIFDIVERLKIKRVDIPILKTVLAQRAGITYERAPNRYQYAHRSFQEHLSACYLVGEGRYPQQIVAEIRKSPALWRNVMELIPDEAKRQGRDLWQLVKALLPDKNASVPTDPNDSVWYDIFYATRLIMNHLPKEDDQQDLYRPRIQKYLLEIIEKGLLSPVDRAEMGRMLSEIGDKRAGVGVITTYKIPLPDVVWCHIPAGEFIMGSDDSGQDDEKPAHTLHLDDFYMSRYLVTYAQYRAFEEADDFGDETWWEGFPEDEKRKKNDQAFKYDNHPQERVTWYMAMAFCRWLTHHLDVAKLPMRVWDMTTKTYQTMPYQKMKITLPSEAEYEKSARGTDGRIYPYGNDFDATKGNTSATGIGKTSAVGMFPRGESPYGVLDGSGNVWTWTCSLRKDYKYNSNDGREDESGTGVRIVRGGSWDDSADGARASFRNLISPLNRNDVIGFFVVCRPY
ncbi:MAG: SUMF1/EgtB/PvdO family nonheme iron enzyme [bacterium]|nr:SUMF1/EgtB/PvdO family nonheme iron enzyme [bacterium]